ncbi:MAG: hypothetical protein Q9165_001991 [Trypethelium subeluteriae]
MLPFFQNEMPSNHVVPLADPRLLGPERISQNADAGFRHGNRVSPEPIGRGEGRVKKRKRRTSDHELPSRGQDSESLGELEVCRKRLLGQGDWLELAPARLLQLHFSEQQKRKRFGKRRKNMKELRLAEKLRTRLPVPDDNVSREVPLMSGALKNTAESVHVRIGKDALATDARVSGQSSVNNEHTFQRDSSLDSMLLDAEEAKELGVEQLIPAKFYERRAESISTDAEVWTAKALRPPISHIQGSSSADFHDQDSCREGRLIIQGISMDREWKQVSTAYDKTERVPSPSRRDSKDRSPRQKLVFPTSDLGLRSISTSRVDIEDQAEGLQETDCTWRALSSFSNGSSDLALGSSRTQGSLSRSAIVDRETSASQHSACAIGSRICTTSVEESTQELDSASTQVPVLSSHSQFEARGRSGRSPRELRRASFGRLLRFEKISPEPSPAQRDEDLWKRFVFGSEGEPESQVLSHRTWRVPSSVGDGAAPASAWSTAPLALGSSPLNSPV